MTFKPATWYPIALVLTAINAVGAWFAASQAEPTHATVHVALALGFGVWAQRLRPRPGRGAEPRLEAQFEALELEISKLRRELSETQERLDFVERMLAQEREKPRVGPQR